MSKYPITAGKTAKGSRIVLYGVEGIGKTTLASQFPGAVFIDTEGSTSRFDVPRYPSPSSWSMLIDEIREMITDPAVQTVVIDTGDWAEKLCVREVCSRANKSGIEDFGYGAGYSYATEEFGRMLDLLSDVAEHGKHVAVILHAAIRSFTNPEEMGAYNRYTLELIDTPKCSNSSAVKQWADAVLFANYKDLIVEDDKTKKKYALGGDRVLYTQRTPAWDAKNRFGLRPEIPMTIEALAPLFDAPASVAPTARMADESAAAPALAPATPAMEAPKPARATKAKAAATAKPKAEPTPVPAETAPQAAANSATAIPQTESWIGIPKELADLMAANGVDPFEVRMAVFQKGYYPYDTPISGYDPGFITGCLVGAWDKMFEVIKENRATDLYKGLDLNSDELPF